MQHKHHQKSIMKSLILLLTSIITLLTVDGWSPKLEKKINTSILQTYKISSYELLPAASEQQDKSMGLFYRVVQGDQNHGFIYVDKAPSMKNVFDYMIMFDNQYRILKTKVLIYREKHGRQIGTRRWLKQFDGLTPADKPELGVTIDGISGATISATSMTKAVANVLLKTQATSN